MRLRPWTGVLLAATLAACDARLVPPPAAGPALNALGIPQDGETYPNGNPYRVAALQELPVVGVTVDSQSSGFPAANLTDGNLATQWANGGYRNATAWAAVRLPSSASLASLGLKTGPSPTGTSYDVQVSNDGQAWSTVLAHQTNATWGLETKSLPAGTRGAYLRIFWHNAATAPQPHFAIFELAIDGANGVAPSMTPFASHPPSPSPSTRATPTPRPSPSHTPTPMPSTTTTGGQICPPVKPAPGGGTTCYPAGTVFLSGDINVTIGPGGVYTPSHLYLRPGSTTHFRNLDTKPHTLTGFGGANFDAVIQPGATFGKHWTHFGTWTFHDRLTPNPPTFAVTDDPATP